MMKKSHSLLQNHLHNVNNISSFNSTKINYQPKVLCIIRVKDEKSLPRFLKILKSFNIDIIDVDEENRRVVFDTNIADFIKVLSIVKDYSLTATIQLSSAYKCKLRRKYEVINILKSKTPAMLITQRNVYAIVTVNDTKRILIEVMYKGEGYGVIRLRPFKALSIPYVITYPIPESLTTYDLFQVSEKDIVYIGSKMNNTLKILRSELCRD